MDHQASKQIFYLQIGFPALAVVEKHPIVDIVLDFASAL